MGTVGPGPRTGAPPVPVREGHMPEDVYFEKGGPPRIFNLEQLQLYNQKRALDRARWEAKQRAAQQKQLKQEVERQEALERETKRLQRAAANQGKGKKRKKPK